MDCKVTNLNRSLKWIDRELYAKRENTGAIHIYRKHKTYVPYKWDKGTLFYQVDCPFLIFPLTEDWTVRSKPVDWGTEPVVDRLKMIDAWNRPQLFRDLEQQSEKVDEGKKRDQYNRAEAFMYDFHSQFKKTFSDVNTSQMSKRPIKEKK